MSERAASGVVFDVQSSQVALQGVQEEVLKGARANKTNDCASSTFVSS
jgi:hypothetical protein